MAPQTRTFFGTEGQTSSCVLPHHLFIIAAASVSKQNDLCDITAMAAKATKSETKKEETCQRESFDDVDGLEKAIKIVEEETEEQEEESNWSEERLIKKIDCTVKKEANGLSLKLLLKLEDDMNRQLCRPISDEDSGMDLSTELVEFGLISECDRDMVASTIQNCINSPV